MGKLFIGIIAMLLTAGVTAAEYGNYDPMKLLSVTQTPAGKQHGVDVVYMDRMIAGLSVHAKNYPAQFDNKQDRQRAVRDAGILVAVLDTLINVPQPGAELLLRAGYVNSMAHNLDIPEAAGKADAIFLQLLSAEPANPQGNYLYGTLLAGVGKPGAAIPYLEKAFSLGVIDAAYAMGFAYVAQGDKVHALQYLEEYRRRRPEDDRVDMLIEAVRNDKVRFSQR